MDVASTRRIGIHWTWRVATGCALSWLVVANSGCQPSQPTPGQPPAAGQSGQSPTAGESQGATSKIEQALAKLSPEDRQAAEAQKNCPVSGEPLGSMGTPIKFDVEGRTVWVCCAGCEQPVKDDPATYLAKLPATATPEN